MKQEVIQYAKSKLGSSDSETKKFGKIIIKNIDNFNCYYCLDTGKTWRERDSIFAKLDGRGNYDIRKCNRCSNDSWIQCSHTQNHNSPLGIKIFRTNNVSLNDIIAQLKIIYKNKLLEDDPEWNLYKKDTIEKKTKETEIQVNIKDLANVVKSSLAIYAGNILELVNQVEDITINLSNTLTQENDSKEIIKRYTTKIKNEYTNNDETQEYYLLFKMNKSLKERSYLGSTFKSKKFTFQVSYLILSPKNKTAQNKCNELMNDNIENKLDSFIF